MGESEFFLEQSLSSHVSIEEVSNNQNEGAFAYQEMTAP